MKTDRQIGSRRLHPGKPVLGFSRSRRRASAKEEAWAPASPTTQARLEKIRRAPRPTLAAQLTANLELEFNSTPREHSPLEISNRKFSRVFRPDSALNSRRLVTHHPTLVTALLIYGPAIKNHTNPQGFNDVQFSNWR